jgi:hypothetical protein
MTRLTGAATQGLANDLHLLMQLACITDRQKARRR